MICVIPTIDEQYFDMIPNPATCPCCRGLRQVRGNRRKRCDQMAAAWRVISHRKWPLYSLQNWEKRCETPKSRTSSARTQLCSVLALENKMFWSFLWIPKGIERKFLSSVIWSPKLWKYCIGVRRSSSQEQNLLKSISYSDEDIFICVTTRHRVIELIIYYHCSSCWKISPTSAEFHLKEWKITSPLLRGQDVRA